MKLTLFCLLFANLVRTTEVSEVTWKLLGVSLFSRLPHSPMQLLLDLLKVHQRLDWLIWKVKHCPVGVSVVKRNFVNVVDSWDSAVLAVDSWFQLLKLSTAVKAGDSFKILTKLELQNLNITSASKFGPNFTNWFGLAKFCKVRQREVAWLFQKLCDFTHQGHINQISKRGVTEWLRDVLLRK